MGILLITIYAEGNVVYLSKAVEKSMGLFPIFGWIIRCT